MKTDRMEKGNTLGLMGRLTKGIFLMDIVMALERFLLATMK